MALKEEKHKISNKRFFFSRSDPTYMGDFYTSQRALAHDPELAGIFDVESCSVCPTLFHWVDLMKT
jgi:hypothetical protein